MAAIWILSLGRQEGKWEGKGSPFSLFILISRGGEHWSQLFSLEQGFGGTRTVHAIFHLYKVCTLQGMQCLCLELGPGGAGLLPQLCHSAN